MNLDISESKHMNSSVPIPSSSPHARQQITAITWEHFATITYVNLTYASTRLTISRQVQSVSTTSAALRVDVMPTRLSFACRTGLRAGRLLPAGPRSSVGEISAPIPCSMRPAISEPLINRLHRR